MGVRANEIRLARRPAGLPAATDFELVATELPDLRDGHVLVRNMLFRVAASLRMMIAEGAEDVEGVPFPALRVGDAIAEEALGEVIAAPPGATLRVGDIVKHPLGWRDFAMVPADRCRRLAAMPHAPALVLGHGWTAYAALTRGTQVRAGETVFVAGATGAIGSMAGQIARLLGAGRVIGSAGTRKKADRLIAELRFDDAVVRTSGRIDEQLAAIAPDGIDLAIDLVGGDHLAALVANMRRGGRVLVLGALSGQLATDGTGRTAPVTLDGFQLLLRKLTLRGYSADDDPDAEAEWESTASKWVADGSMCLPATTVNGLANAPAALADLIGGSYLGTVFVAP